MSPTRGPPPGIPTSCPLRRPTRRCGPALAGPLGKEWEVARGAPPVAAHHHIGQIEDLFESLYTRAGVPYDDAQFSGRSDYQAFINNGIPSGGLFTGAEVPKTAAQAAIWGGTAGVPYDPCNHQACDTMANLSLGALDVNADVVAAAILTYAYSTASVNGVPGEPVPGGVVLPAPAGPEGTVNLPVGGGPAPDDDGRHAAAAD